MNQSRKNYSQTILSDSFNRSCHLEMFLSVTQIFLSQPETSENKPFDIIKILFPLIILGIGITLGKVERMRERKRKRERERKERERQRQILMNSLPFSRIFQGRNTTEIYRFTYISHRHYSRIIFSSFIFDKLQKTVVIIHQIL